MQSFSYFISEHLALSLCKKGVIDTKYRNAYTYCFEFIFSNLFFICVILLAGIFFTTPVFSIVFLLTLLPMRSFCGGIHAPNRLLCSVFSYLTYFITYLVYLWLTASALSLPVQSVLFLALLTLLNTTGPAETSANDYTGSQQKKMRGACRIYSVLLCLAFLLGWQLQFPFISTMILVCIFITTVSTMLGKEKNHASKRRNLRG